MSFELPVLPYARDALEPHISAETLACHYDEHHRAYVSALNELVTGNGFAHAALEDIIVQAPVGPLQNTAAQAWNHAFYWHSLSPESGWPEGPLARAIDASFGSFARFRADFTGAALKLFGSGWVWLVCDRDGALRIEATENARNPLTTGHQALLACDVWEHSFYIDYRHDKTAYLDGFWAVANWEFAARNLEARAGTTQRFGVADPSRLVALSVS